MAFVRMAFFPGATAQHFTALAAAMADVAPPADRILFAAARSRGWQGRLRDDDLAFG